MRIASQPRKRGISIAGPKLAALRDRLALTQEEFAPRIGLTKNHLSRLENQPSGNINKRSFRLLAEITGMSITRLIDDAAAQDDTAQTARPAGGRPVDRRGNDARFYRLATIASADGVMRFSDARWLIAEQVRRDGATAPMIIAPAPAPSAKPDQRLRPAAKKIIRHPKPSNHPPR